MRFTRETAEDVLISGRAVDVGQNTHFWLLQVSAQSRLTVPSSFGGLVAAASSVQVQQCWKSFTQRRGRDSHVLVRAMPPQLPSEACLALGKGNEGSGQQVETHKYLKDDAGNIRLWKRAQHKDPQLVVVLHQALRADTYPGPLAFLGHQNRFSAVSGVVKGTSSYRILVIGTAFSRSSSSQSIGAVVYKSGNECKESSRELNNNNRAKGLPCPLLSAVQCLHWAVSVVSGSLHCNVDGHRTHDMWKILKTAVLVVTDIHTINKYIPWPPAHLKTTGPGDGTNDVGGWYEILAQTRAAFARGQREESGLEILAVPGLPPSMFIIQTLALEVKPQPSSATIPYKDRLHVLGVHNCISLEGLQSAARSGDPSSKAMALATRG
ncbi:hypothetical protein DV515_00008710 [Chloebia gouldiae]|uniref:Uncharacterized protein n=1 Tax=Chloebia gouldiae TaxID=44316 RepID=A0A3L8SEZ6_CHLGU|nr:hypothetical protein DV515_00008710 [Chloebia gouldiae]